MNEEGVRLECSSDDACGSNGHFCWSAGTGSSFCCPSRKAVCSKAANSGKNCTMELKRFSLFHTFNPVLQVPLRSRDDDLPFVRLLRLRRQRKQFSYESRLLQDMSQRRYSPLYLSLKIVFSLRSLRNFVRNLCRGSV